MTPEVVRSQPGARLDSVDDARSRRQSQSLKKPAPTFSDFVCRSLPTKVAVATPRIAYTEEHIVWNIFTQLVLLVGRITPEHVQMLGTGFLVSSNGLIITTRHVTGSDDSNLVILAPHISDINAYQDLSDTSCKPVPARIAEIDPIRDLALLKVSATWSGKIPEIGSFDADNVGDNIGIFRYPHCVEGRRALTFQNAELGAKVLLESSGVKSKHAVINIQSRPGQFGSLIFSHKNNRISGVLIGAWGPSGGGGISLGGIDPRELHQTTHCISAEYVSEML